jgi:enterochelin esterase-like enzyme
LVVALVAALALVLAPQGQVREDSYHSHALGGQLPFAVYLPPGYSFSNRRYPVIYFLHGLPASPYAYRGIGFIASALDALGRPAIVIAPRGARDGDTDPEYLDWGPGRNWETAISTELPAYVDAHYRTIPTRLGRALVGVSAGGYGAVILAMNHLSSFSVVESWSGYFRPTNPAGTEVLPHTTSQSAHTLIPQLHADEQRRPTFFAFYVGSGDTRFRNENELLNQELSTARVPHVFRIYPGAHNSTVWQAHAKAWLALALNHLAAPTQQ